MVRYKPALTTVHSGESERDWVERIRYALNNHDFYTIQQSIVDLEGENEGFLRTAHSCVKKAVTPWPAIYAGRRTQ